MSPRSATTTAVMALMALLVWTDASRASADGVWVSLAPGGGPAAREGHVMIYDAGRDRIIVHGGATTISNRFDDVWAYPLTTDGPWEQLTPAGTAPSARVYHSAIYDPVAERMVIFGGFGDGALSDVWALDLAGTPEWHQLTPSGNAPSARYWHSAVYAPSSHRMIVYGGTGFGTAVYELDLTEGAEEWWAMLPTGPAARCCHEAVFSVASSSMIVFGGWNGGELGDLWSLSGAPAAWSALNLTGPERTDHVAVLDPSRSRVIVHGGARGTTALADVWAASLNAPYAWSLLAPTGLAPEARVEHAAVYDPLRDRMILFGGRTFGWKEDLWALDFRGSTDVPGPPSSALGLALHRTWHTANALHLDLTATAGRVRIEVMDVAGRRVLARTVDLSSDARQGLEVPCNIACGLYFVRVSQGVARAGGRVAVVEH